MTKENIIKSYQNNFSFKFGPNWIVCIPEQKLIDDYSKESRYHTLYIKHCTICNSSFKHGLKTTSICKCCKLFIKCNYCNNYFKTNKPIYFINQIENNEKIIAYCSRKCSCKINGTENIKKFNERVKTDKELQEIMYKARSYVGKNFGKKNIYKALESLHNEHHDILVQNGKNVQKWLDDNPEERIRINTENAQKAGIKNKELWDDPKWAERQREICLENLEKAYKISNYLWENDKEWAEKQKNILAENGKKCGAKNLQKARLKRIEKIKESLNNINISLDYSLIDYNSIISLCKKDICGAYVIKAKFKNSVQTEKEENVHNILVCKSKNLYDEIYWVLKVISQPEKQDKVITDDNPWTIAKWWYISNLYYDFKFILLTDKNGVSEEEALLAEAKYGFDHDMFCDKEQIEIDGYSKNHSYWNL